MILMYYGISTNDRADNNDDISYGNRAGLMARFFDKDSENILLWEDLKSMREIIKNALLSHYEECVIRAPIYETNPSESKEFDEQIKENDKLFKALSEGNPLYASISGKHILVVRGMLVGNGMDKGKLWAICNDPYGYLAVNKSDAKEEKDYNPYETWYTGDPNSKEEQSNPLTRRTRNLSSEHDRKCATKGMHVYYNQTTLSVDNDKKNCKTFKFNHVSYFIINGKISANDRIKFVTKNLVQGK